MPAETEGPVTYLAVVATEDTDVSPGNLMEWVDIHAGVVRPLSGGYFAGVCVEDLPNMKVGPVPLGHKGFFIWTRGYRATTPHVHVFDSDVYCLRYRYSSPRRYTGAVELGCACGKQRLFTPADGQPTKAFWGVDMGSPNPPLESQPPHLKWKD